jgi:hypothetical protein
MGSRWQVDGAYSNGFMEGDSIATAWKIVLILILLCGMLLFTKIEVPPVALPSTAGGDGQLKWSKFLKLNLSVCLI